MKKIERKWVLISVVTIALNGCVVSDTIRTQIEGVAGGAAIGGIAGYIVGGRDGAGIGAGIGAIVGGLLGNDIAKRKKSYVNKEDALDGEIEYYAKLNRSIADSNKQLSADIQKLKRQSNELLAKYKKGEVSKSEILAQKQKIHNVYAKNEEYLEKINKEHKQGVSYLNNDLAGADANSQKIAKLKNEQKKLQNKINQLKKYHKQMAKVEQDLSI